MANIYGSEASFKQEKKRKRQKQNWHNLKHQNQKIQKNYQDMKILNIQSTMIDKRIGRISDEKRILR